jgi:hypothetical protein
LLSVWGRKGGPKLRFHGKGGRAEVDGTPAISRPGARAHHHGVLSNTARGDRAIYITQLLDASLETQSPSSCALAKFHPRCPPSSSATRALNFLRVPILKLTCLGISEPSHVLRTPAAPNKSLIRPSTPCQPEDRPLSVLFREGKLVREPEREAGRKREKRKSCDRVSLQEEDKGPSRPGIKLVNTKSSPCSI